MAATIDATATSPRKKRKRQDSHGSLADTEDISIDYTRDSHDIVVTKSRRYTKKNKFMNSLGLNKSAKAPDIDTSGASGDNKRKGKEMSTAPSLSNDCIHVNGSSDTGTDGAGDGKKKKKKKQRERDGEMSTGSSQTEDGGVVNGSSEDLLLSPSKGALLRRKYRRERTSSQSSTDPGTASSLTDYFPPSGEVKVTEEERSRLASEQNSQTHSDMWPSLISHSESYQARNKESQPPILLGPDGLLLEDDGFKKPLHPVPSSPSKYSRSLETGSSRKKEKKKRKKNGSDDTSGIDTDTGASVSTVQSEDDEERRHKKKKKKKDRDVESNTLEGQDTRDLAVQSASEDVEGGKEKRHKKKKKKGKDRDEECNASEGQVTSGSMLQSGEEEEGAEEKIKKKKKDKERDIESNTSKEQGTSLSTFHSGNEGGEDERKHKKKKKKKDREKDSNTSEAQTTETEGSDVFPLAQKSPKGDKPKKKHKKGNEGSAVDSDSQVTGQEILSQDTRANGAASSETGTATDSDMVSKKKKKSKKKRAESTGTSESEVPESDVGSPVKSPLPLPRTVTVREGGSTETVAKNKPTSTANKLPSWCIEDAGQESQTVSEVFDQFGWGQNKVSSSGSKLPSEGMIRTTSTQPNFDSVVDLGRGADTECGEKDNVPNNQPQDEGIVPPTPTKRKNKLSRKGKEKSDKSKAMGDGKEQESVVENDNVDVVEYSAWIENEGRQADKEGPEKDVALNNSSKDEGSSAVVPRSKRTLSRKEKQKSANSKNNGEKQQEGAVNEGTVSNGGGKQNEPASSGGLGESQLEENTANATVSVDTTSVAVPKKSSKDDALNNSSKDEGSSSIGTKSKRKLSRKEKQKSANSKAINSGEVQREANVTDTTSDAVSRKSAEVNRAKGTKRGKASNVLEGKESGEKEPAAKKNTTKKGSKKVKEGSALEEEESTMDKEPAVKRRRTKSKANQQDNLYKETIIEEVKEEETQETVTEENAVEDRDEEHPEDHSSGEDFQTDIAAVPATGRKQAVRISHPRKAKETHRSRAATVSDPEVLWLKGMKALTAEDKEWLKEKGIKVTMGHYSTKEKAILKKNMESFCELYGVADPRTLLYPTQYEDKENLKKLIHEAGLFRHLAQGLNRPLWNVYTKARQMYFNPEMEGSFSKQEDKRLLQLVKQHGCRWAAISLIMGRFEDHLKHRWRRLNRIDQGHWSAEEDRKLVKAVRRVTGRKDIRNIFSGVNWANVAIEMDNKRSDKQCREHWRVLLNTLFVGEGTRIWNLKRDAKLIDEIYRSGAEVSYDIDWEAITENLPWVHHPGVASKRWIVLKTRVPDRNKMDMDEILDYLKEDLKKKIEVQKTKRELEEKRIRELKSEPYVRTSDEEDSSDDDDDDIMSDDNTDDDAPNADDGTDDDAPDADDDAGSNPDCDDPTPSAEQENTDEGKTDDESKPGVNSDKE